MSEYLDSLSIQRTKTILNQMQNYFYKFKTIEGRKGIGFFYKIKYKTEKILVFMTSNDIIDDANDTTINILINNEYKIVEFGDTTYRNKKINIKIKEIKNNFKEHINFFEIDDLLYEKEGEMYLVKEPIYFIHLNNNNEILVSYSFIKNINKSKFIYNYKIKKNYKFSLILNSSNNKIIGINDNSLNSKGDFFNVLITEFMRKYEILNKMKKNNKYRFYQNKKNEINIVLKVDEKDINKEIYFLDDKYYNFEEKKYAYCRNNLKELNKNNTELYIENIKYEYKKYFIPEKEGKYNIKLIFNTNITDCSFMFVGCENIISIDLSSFNTK